MNTSTLFSAYTDARNQMAIWYSARGSNVGISVNDDYHARQWQRYARLAAKLERAISERLACNDAHDANLAAAERLAEALKTIKRLASRHELTDGDWDTYIAPIMCEQSNGPDEGAAFFDAIEAIARAALADWQSANGGEHAQQ